MKRKFLLPSSIVFSVGLIFVVTFLASCQKTNNYSDMEYSTKNHDVIIDSAEIDPEQSHMQDIYFQTSDEYEDEMPYELRQWIKEQWVERFVFDLSEVYTAEQIERLNVFKNLVGEAIDDIEARGFEVDSTIDTLPMSIYFNNSAAKLYLINDIEHVPENFSDIHTLSQFFIVSKDGIIQSMLPPRRNLADWYTIVEVRYEDINGDGMNEMIIQTATFPLWGADIEWNSFHFYFYENGEFIEHLELSNQVTNAAEAMRIYPLPRRDPSFPFDLYFIPDFEYMLNYARRLFLR